MKNYFNNQKTLSTPIGILIILFFAVLAGGILIWKYYQPFFYDKSIKNEVFVFPRFV
ncbi:hypothetical protein KKA09_02335 [Patescibacteria group bacterium]|nr:hypothetical protein [Patescibacteria group bacterium]